MAGTYGGLTFAGLWSDSPYFEDTLALSGAGTLTFPTRTPAIAVAAALSGSGTLLFPTRNPAFTGTTTLTGSGTLTLPTRTPAFAVALGLSGSGTLGLAGTPAFTRTLALSGSGTLANTVSGLQITQSLALTGAGSLTFLAAPAFAVALGLSGSGTQTRTASPGFTDALALSGSGTQTRTATPAFAVSLALSGSGSLTFPSYVPSFPVALGLSGAGTLTFPTRTPAFAVQLALSGSGTLSLVLTPALAVSLALSGSGTQTRTAAPGFADALALSGSGTQTRSGTPAFTDNLALSGSGTLTFPTRTPAFAVPAALSGSGTLTFPTRTPAFADALALSGSGTLSRTAAPGFTDTLALSGSGTQTRTAVPAFARPLALSGSGTLARSATPAFAVDLALTGAGSLTFAAAPAFARNLDLSGSGTLTFPTRTPGFTGPAGFTGSGALTLTAVPAFLRPLALSGSGTLTLVSGANFAGPLLLSGSGSLGLFGIIVAFGDLNLSSEGTLSLSAIGFQGPTGAHPPLPGSAAIVEVVPLKWRYVMADLRTDATIDEFELSDVRFDQRINQPGAFSATYAMPNAAAAAKGRQIAEARTVCYVYRGLEVYAGPYVIWSTVATGDPRGGTKLALTGAGLESYFNRREVRTDLNFVQVDQLAIARALITTPQADTGGDVLVQTDTALSGVLRDRTEWTSTSGSFYGARLGELAAVENGFEFRIISYIDPSIGQRVRRFITGYPHLGRPDVDHVFTYPGRVVGWSQTRDATAGATSFRSRGDTPITEEITEALEPVMGAVVDRDDLLSTGWPRIDRTDDYSSVTTVSVLDGHTRENAAIYGGSAKTLAVSVRLSPDGAGDFTPNDLGSSARLVIQDDYLGLLNETWRVVGMDVKPSSRDGVSDIADLIFEVVGA